MPNVTIFPFITFFLLIGLKTLQIGIIEYKNGIDYSFFGYLEQIIYILYVGG